MESAEFGVLFLSLFSVEQEAKKIKEIINVKE
jgi:hypothetical protein